jgi:pyruvate/2-oxoglutarate dehydrogenase complex dihydrolipoamide dehydrogenase (E3) component
MTMNRSAAIDLCIIGSGSAGFSAAQTAKRLEKRAVIVDRDPALAGQCILRGCMPAKTLLHAAEVAHVAANARESGVDVPKVEVDPAKVVQRERKLVQSFARYRREELAEFEIVRGCARFVDERTIDVDGQRITAEAFLIATGSQLVVPPIDGLDDCGYITPEAALNVTTPFESLVVLGGGPVGCEFAQYFARTGTRVTLLQDAPHLLRAEDDDVAEAVARGLREDGIEIVTGVTFHGASTCGDGKSVTVEVDGAPRRFEASEILCTVDRRPNFAGLDLARCGVRTNGAVDVDETLRTSNPRIYAAGDVIGRRMLVHAAIAGGELAARNALGETTVAIDPLVMDAHAVYTDPEVAVAGLTEREAARRCVTFRSASYPFSEHGRAITDDAIEGFVKMLASPDGKILGITIVGKDASELVHEALTLLYFGASAGDVLRIPHLHPTIAEILTYPASELAAE